ncbi:MAG: hypothetical protein Q9167_000032 [Letrouitia subvulpina]
MEKQPERQVFPFWDKALVRFQEELEEDDADEYQTILEAGTLEQLVEHIKCIDVPNGRERAVLSRLDPTLKFLNDFSAIVAVSFGADTKMTALVWASIRLILSLASSTNDNLQEIVDILEELSLTLTRFRQYEKTLPIDNDFESALVDVYTEVICFYARTIRFYRSNPNGLLRRNGWPAFHVDFKKTIQRIKRLSSLVETEAEATRMKMEQNTYAEVVDLMKKMKADKAQKYDESCYHVPLTVNPRFWGRSKVMQKITEALKPEVQSEEQRRHHGGRSEDKKWLLVLDNADDAAVFKHVWPLHFAGSILLTTRNPNIAFNFAKDFFHVEPFDDTEGSQLLLKLSGVEKPNESDQGAAQAISHTLGGLPLALDQIGGFIQQRRIALRDFLRLYKRNVDKIDAKKTGITDDEHTISTVLEVSLNNLAGQSQILLEVLAFMNPEKIDEVILREAPLAAPTFEAKFAFLTDEIDLLDAEGLLQGTMINKTGEASFLSVHRLLQAAVMRRLSPQAKVGYFNAVIGFLCWGFPDTFSKDIGHQHQSWERCEMCLPHVDHIVKLQELYSNVLSDTETFAQLLLRCCWYLYEREIYAIARSWIKVALNNFHDRSTLAFASAIELQGLIEMDLNNQTSALDSFICVLNIRTALLGPDDAFIAASLTTLGIVHTELGNLAEAYSYHEKAIDIRLRTNSDRIGNSYSNMSSLLLRMDKADEAEKMLKRCPSLKNFTDDTFLNTGNPRFSGDMVLLARIRQRQGHDYEALRLATKALGFRQKLLGDRLKTCDSLYQVAELLRKRGDFAFSINLLNECIAISGSLVEGEGQQARAMYKLSLVLREQDRIKQSEDALEKATSLRKRIRGAENVHETKSEAEAEKEYDRLNLWMLW